MDDVTPADAGARFTCRDVPPGRHVPTLAEDVREGFACRPRWLKPKYFYDEHGSALFDRICDTPEYYPTRTEAALLDAHADEIAATVRPEHLVELGAGTSRKTVALLAACERAGLAPVYWPFDVCRGVLEEAGMALTARFPWLRVEALVGDYTAGLDHLPRPPGRCLYAFLGGTIGNFEPDESRRLLGELAARMDDRDRLLLGADRVKDRATLEAAYNDAEGVTAAFNRNVLHVINRELDGDFAVEDFVHDAIYNDVESRIEMRLRAQHPQEVTLAALGERYRFAAGEPLRTEISRKFTAPGLEAELGDAGLRCQRWCVADGDYFSLTLAGPGR